MVMLPRFSPVTRAALVAACAALGPPGPAVAAPPPDAASVVARLQKLYDGTRDFSAAFTQNYEMKALGRAQQSRGRVAFVKPGRIRFDYEQPAAKTFAVEGSTLWIYQPADGQALVNRCFEADGLTASLVFLGGGGRISEQFDTALEPADEAHLGLRLVPRKPQAAFRSILLWVDRRTFEVRRSVVEDASGNPNAFEFSAVKRNAGLKAAQATFIPPAGVAVNPVPGSCAAAPGP